MKAKEFLALAVVLMILAGFRLLVWLIATHPPRKLSVSSKNSTGSHPSGRLLR